MWPGACALHALVRSSLVNAPESLSRRSNLDATLLGRTAPLPIASYFDAAWFERELQHLFAPGPNYAGSEMMVPEVGDYMTLPSTAHGKVLVHGPAGINLLSNTCRHRQGLLLDGKGNNANIVCPLHRWTYDLNGKLLGATDFDVTPDCSLPQYAADALERTAVCRPARSERRSARFSA